MPAESAFLAQLARALGEASGAAVVLPGDAPDAYTAVTIRFTPPVRLLALGDALCEAVKRPGIAAAVVVEGPAVAVLAPDAGYYLAGPDQTPLPEEAPFSDRLLADMLRVLCAGTPRLSSVPSATRYLAALAEESAAPAALDADWPEFVAAYVEAGGVGSGVLALAVDSGHLPFAAWLLAHDAGVCG